MDADMTEAMAFLSEHTWLALSLFWVFSILAATEMMKAIWDLFLDPEHPKRSGVMRLAPFVFGLSTGWAVAPLIAETTAFAAVGWLNGLPMGAGAGLSAIGCYEVTKNTRPLRMIQVLVRGLFRRLYQLATGQELSADDESKLDKTQNHPPVDPKELT